MVSPGVDPTSRYTLQQSDAFGGWVVGYGHVGSAEREAVEGEGCVRGAPGDAEGSAGCAADLVGYEGER